MATPRHLFPVFLRHRFRVHAQGWLRVGVGLLTAHFVELYAHEPLWAVLPAAFLAAFFVVALGRGGGVAPALSLVVFGPFNRRFDGLRMDFAPSFRASLAA